MNNFTKQIKNAQGLRNLEQTKLVYSREILAALSDDPSLVDVLTGDLGISDIELFEKLSGSTQENITFYDQSFSSVRLLSKIRNNHPNKTK